MPLKIIRDDITKLSCDAIVNAANPSLLGGGGVDGAIHKAAGKELLAECRTLDGCQTGEAKITSGYALPCRFVIHTVGPIWEGGAHGEEALLRASYRNSLALALEHGCESVAFPLLSSGAYGYPKEQALRVAVEEITSFLLENELLVYLVIYDKTSYQIGGKLFCDIAAYVDDRYVEEHPTFRRRVPENSLPLAEETASAPDYSVTAFPVGKKAPAPPLSEILKQLDESFSEMLLRKIDERGMTDAACYKKANIDRKLFSKIRGDRLYRPSKATALAFAVALELSLSETQELLQKAGFALSHSSKFDLIVEYFIANQNYDVFEINEALFAFDQPLLGG